MINVVESFKLIKVVIEGKEHVVKAEDTTSWNVIKVKTKEGITTANEGDTINFITESGEIKKGSIIKLSGKKEKVKIQIVPEQAEHEETWGVISMKEDTFVVEGAEIEPVDEEVVDDDIEDEE